jgi:hypothetical protein
VIDQLLKSKYHVIHLEIFTDSQLDTIDKVLNKAARNALGLTASFPTEAIHRPKKDMGLGYATLKDKATQMGIEHLMEILDKPTDRGYLAYGHTSRVAINYQHWPKEAHEANQAKLPTLRILSYIQHIAGAELEHILNLQAPNHIATSIRAVSKARDRREQGQPPGAHPNKSASKRLRQATTEPMPTTQILGQDTKISGPTVGGGSIGLDTHPRKKKKKLEGHTAIYILNAKATHDKLQSGDQQCPSDNLETALTTLRTTLTIPTSQEHRKLPKTTTSRSQKIHASWHQYIDY